MGSTLPAHGSCVGHRGQQHPIPPIHDCAPGLPLHGGFLHGSFGRQALHAPDLDPSPSPKERQETQARQSLHTTQPGSSTRPWTLGLTSTSRSSTARSVTLGPKRMATMFVPGAWPGPAARGCRYPNLKSVLQPPMSRCRGASIATFCAGRGVGESGWGPGL